jgi:hypothetical protein
MMSIVPPTRSSVSVLAVCSDDADRPCTVSRYSVGLRVGVPERARLTATLIDGILCWDCVGSSESASDARCEWPDSAMVTNRGIGLGSRKSRKLLLRSSKGVFVKRAHHELLRRIGSFSGGFGSRIEEGLGERVEPDPALWSELVWCEVDEIEREFCDICSTKGDSGTKSVEGGSAVRSAGGLAPLGRRCLRSGSGGWEGWGSGSES